MKNKVLIILISVFIILCGILIYKCGILTYKLGVETYIQSQQNQGFAIGAFFMFPFVIISGCATMAVVEVVIALVGLLVIQIKKVFFKKDDVS